MNVKYIVIPKSSIGKKELKYDFGADSFNVRSFWATEAALNFVMIGYNIMSLFKQMILQSPKEHKLSTLRYRVFAIGGYLVKNGNQKILKLSLSMKLRKETVKFFV